VWQEPRLHLPVVGSARQNIAIVKHLIKRPLLNPGLLWSIVQEAEYTASAMLELRKMSIVVRPIYAKAAQAPVSAILFGAYLAAVIPGLFRDLDSDETWVAKSILATSLHRCLYYDAWLQSAPQAFLISGCSSALQCATILL
jgi:hypothetical protein